MLTELPKSILLALAEHDEVESWIVETGGSVCIYCGEDAEQLDHLVPRNLSGDTWREYVPLVPSCGDCNRRISATTTPYIAERCEVVSSSLKSKHKKLLSAPGISQDEVQELTGSLRAMVEARSATRIVVRARLSVLDSGGACNFDATAFYD